MAVKCSGQQAASKEKKDEILSFPSLCQYRWARKKYSPERYIGDADSHCI